MLLLLLLSTLALSPPGERGVGGVRRYQMLSRSSGHMYVLQQRCSTQPCQCQWGGGSCPLSRGGGGGFCCYYSFPTWGHLKNGFRPSPTLAKLIFKRGFASWIQGKTAKMIFKPFFCGTYGTEVAIRLYHHIFFLLFCPPFAFSPSGDKRNLMMGDKKSDSPSLTTTTTILCTRALAPP